MYDSEDTGSRTTIAEDKQSEDVVRLQSRSRRPSGLNNWSECQCLSATCLRELAIDRIMEYHGEKIAQLIYRCDQRPALMRLRTHD